MVASGGESLGEQANRLGLIVIDELLKITTGTPNDRPPADLVKPIDERTPKPAPKSGPDAAKELALGIVETMVFGYQPLGAGDEIPPQLRPSVVSENGAISLGADDGQQSFSMLPMWNADP